MDKMIVIKAIDFAEAKHRTQIRKNIVETPYITHPLRVFALLKDIGGITDPEVLAAALLHDTLEDTDTTETELETEFGKRVCSLVKEVSDDKSLPKSVRKLLQIKHASMLSKDATQIKIADKIANLEDVINRPPVDWDMERRWEYLRWAESVVKRLSSTNENLLTLFCKVLNEGKNQLQEPEFMIQQMRWFDAHKRSIEDRNPEKYNVYIDDNFHCTDPDERIKYGEFDTQEEAVEACKSIVDKDLENIYNCNKDRCHSAEYLYSAYTGLGDDPFVISPDGMERASFSAWDYAEERCREMMLGKKEQS